MYIDSSVADRLLLAAGRHHSADVARRPAHRQVSALYDGARLALHHRHGCRAERAFPQSVDAHDGALGSEDVPRAAAAPSLHAATLHQPRPHAQGRGADVQRRGAARPRRAPEDDGR